MCHTSSSIVISSSSMAFEVEMVPSATPRKQSLSNRSGRSQGISTGSSNGGRVQHRRENSLVQQPSKGSGEDADGFASTRQGLSTHPRRSAGVGRVRTSQSTSGANRLLAGAPRGA